MRLNSNYFKPELLAPGGNLQKLKIAFHAGADAVYVGGTVFGLRKYADNFTNDELRAAVDLANDAKKQVYVVLNGFAHDTDLEDLRPHLDDLQSIQPHAVLVSDWGVAKMVTTHTSIPLHVSTQASVTNTNEILQWKSMGAQRVVMAREVSIADCHRIKQTCDIELEIFIHGSMCASYSGKCVISNYSAGRDSNRGGCVQSCRHQYHIDTPHGPVTSHIMNAKDLYGVQAIEATIRAGIDSLKIEGRMKSQLYVANAVSVYREAIDRVFDAIQSDSIPSDSLLDELETRLKIVSNREFSLGGLRAKPDITAVNRDFGGYQKSVELIATTRAVNGNKALLECKDVIRVGDQVMGRTGIQYRITAVQDLLHSSVDYTRPGGLFWVDLDRAAMPFEILVVPQ